MEFCAICTASALATWNRVEDAALTLALTLTLITRTTYPNRVLDFVYPDWFLVFWKAELLDSCEGRTTGLIFSRPSYTSRPMKMKSRHE